MKNILQSFPLRFSSVMMPLLAAFWFFHGKTEAGSICMLAWAVLIGSGQICTELRATREK